VTDLTSDRIPLRDIPINHQLQARLAEAHVRIAELHTAVTTVEPAQWPSTGYVTAAVRADAWAAEIDATSPTGDPN
jgi:hypothetical protein